MQHRRLVLPLRPVNVDAPGLEEGLNGARAALLYGSVEGREALVTAAVRVGTQAQQRLHHLRPVNTGWYKNTHITCDRLIQGDTNTQTPRVTC